MSVTVTRTKIRIPHRREDLLSRGRLTKILDDLLDYPFALISAPAGYGKTCLMIDLAHQAQFPICWYSIDSLDRDLQRFFTYLIHSLRAQFPGLGENFLSLVEDLTDPSKHIDQLAATLVNDLILGTEEHFAVFLDDFHLLENTSPIQSFISKLGQQMDDNVHLVLASRSKFSFPDLPLLIGRKQVKGIDISDLAFRAEEIKTYLELKLDQPVPLEDCRSLETRTEGWITGLLLFAYHGWGLLVDQGKALKVTGANIGDYFESQIYEKQAGWAQDLMLKTSLLDEFNAETCSVIFGEPEGNSWNDLIALLLENNLFVELIEDRGPWVRYHNLYKDFLQAKLAEDENKRWKLLELVYHHHLSQQDWEKAFAAARTIDDPRVMAETIEQASSPLFHAGRINLLAEWLEILPKEGYEVCLRLKILNGAITTIIENPISGFKIIDDLLNLDAIRATRDLYLKGLVSRATTYRLLGQYNKALSDIDTIFDSNTKQVEDLNILGEAYRESGLILNHLGKYTNSINSFRKSLDTYKQKQDYKNLALVHLDMGLVLMEHGDFDASMNHFQQALKTWTSQNNYPKLSILHNNLGILRLFTGDFPGSKEDLIIAISYAEKTSNIRMQAFSLASLGDLSLALGKTEESITYYIKSLGHAHIVHEAYLIHYININLGKCYRLLGDFSLSKKHLTIAQKYLESEYYDNDISGWNLEQGFFYLETSNVNDAKIHFSIAEESFTEIRKPYDAAKALFGLALCALAESRVDLLQSHLRDFFTTVDPLETLYPLLPLLNRYQSQLERAAAELPALPSLENLLEEVQSFRDTLPDLQQELFPQESSSPASGRLEIQAFGGIEVRRAGQRITASEWVHQRTARELLFYLLDQSTGVTKEQVGLTFWPDSSPAQLSCQFKNAIYRLRRALGKEAIQYDPVTHTYQFNHKIDYDYDVETFAELCRRAEGTNEPACKMDLYRQAAALYQHPFAPELDGVWAEPLRHRLYLEYEKALLIIADGLFSEHQYQTCLKFCQELLELDPTNSDALEISLKTLSCLERKTDIIRQYTNYKRSLENEYGIPPSKEIQMIFEKLSE